MVCKKSLYCLKNGPCANYQTRKQIWEDNIRVRENLKNINQSDHYWSFQITNNDFSDYDEPSYKNRSRGFIKCRNFNDCASVTHDTHSTDNGNHLTCLNCLKNSNVEKCVGSKCEGDICNKSHQTKTLSTSSPQLSKQRSHSPSVSVLSTTNNIHNNTGLYGYRNGLRKSLSTAQLKTNTKLKFPSQCNLSLPKNDVQLKKFPSVEVISKLKNYPQLVSKNSSNPSALKMKYNTHSCDSTILPNKLVKNTMQVCNMKVQNCGKRDVKLPPWLSGTPLSRTTKKMVTHKKQIPFATFGCNNNNDIVGSKRTHNVYASTKDVFPNALLAKLQRDNLITKSLKIEKQIRNSLHQDDKSKKINHSSLWLNEINSNQHCERKATKSQFGSQKNLSARKQY